MVSISTLNTTELQAALEGVALDASPTAQAVSAGHVHEPAANTAAVVTLVAPAAGVSNVVGLVVYSYDGAPAAGSLTITDDGTVVFKVDIVASGVGALSFVPPLKFTAATATVVTLAAGGGAVSGIVNVHAWTE